MKQVSVTVNTGISKANRPWYMATFTAGKFVSEPIFISQLEYEYLSTLNIEPATK